MTKRLALALSLLFCLAGPVFGGTAANNPPSSGSGGGGGGAVSSVSGGTNVTCSPTMGAVVCSVSGTFAAAQMPGFTGGDVTSSAGSLTLALGNSTVTLAKMANLAANSFICNNTGSGATPIACTATQAYGVLGVLPAANFPALTGAVTTTAGALATTLTNNVILQGTTDSTATNAQFLGALATGIVKNTTSTGVLSIAAAGTDYQVPLTFSTGLVNTSNTITWVLASGQSGGTTMTCGTASGNGCTFTTTSNATKGQFVVGSTGTFFVDESQTPTSVAGPILSVGSNNAVGSNYLSTFTVTKNANVTGALMQNLSTGTGSWISLDLASSTGTLSFRQLGSGFTTSGLLIANNGLLEEVTGNLVIGSIAASKDTVIERSSRTESARFTSTGNVTIGTGLATSATDGFLYVPSGAGPPTAVPTSPTLNNNVPIYIDRTNKKLYMYVGGWLGGTTPGTFL